jgi:transcriptional repressor NF-X1
MFITCDCQHLKQEMKCNASRTSEGNTKKTLPCDDECARLARNQKLALALNIDPEAHKDDHIPYSNDTLKMFRENVKWAQSQEREIRVFAADEAEKRLRFKPMPPHQRAFIHALSEDFGFDSESMDPEPHRHVALFKTPKFVMAPMKTLAECVRIRTSAEASNATLAETQRKLHASNEIYNGFLLTQPKFGLTLEDLRAEFAASLDSTPGLAYDISYLPSEEIVIKARPVSASTVISASAIEATIKAMKPSLTAISSSKYLSSSVQLCALDLSLNIIRRELDDPANNGGWSQVAAKAAAPRFALRQPTFGEKSVYTVLGSKLRDAKKKKDEMKKAKEEEVVVDDWEEEMRREEAEDELTKAASQSQEDALNGVDQKLEGADNRVLPMEPAELHAHSPEVINGTEPVVDDKIVSINKMESENSSDQ